MATNPKKLQDLLSDLDKVMEYFQQEKFDIDEGIKQYESGMQLASEIKKILKGYELKIKEIQEKYTAE
jgi:exodeoxyribonuclease VII small subunit